MPESALRVLRSIAGVLAGYLVLAGSNMVFVLLMWFPPRAEVSDGTKAILAAFWTAAWSGGAGWLTARIAARKPVQHAGALAGIAVTVTAGSILLAVAVEPLWYKLLYAGVMAPACVAGGWLPEFRRRGAGR